MKDLTKPYGELYLDTEGAAHFDCHTPGECDFETALAAFHTFVALLQRQIDMRNQCPFSATSVTSAPNKAQTLPAFT